MMLDGENFVEDGAPVGAEVIAAAPVLAEQVLTDVVGRPFRGRLSLQLFGDGFANEFGESGARTVEARAQVRLNFDRQPDGDGHCASLMYYVGVIHNVRRSRRQATRYRPGIPGDREYGCFGFAGSRPRPGNDGLSFCRAPWLGS